MNSLWTRTLARWWWRLRDAGHAVYFENVRRRYQIHPTVRFGYGTEVYGPGKISIGEATYLGRDCYLSASPADASIEIGRNCAIAHNVHIRSSDFRRTANFKDAFDAPSDWSPIRIGDYVWIGCHVYVCAGVTIGSNSIIGANAVVSRDVPANTVVGGVPARVIHHKSSYSS